MNWFLLTIFLSAWCNCAYGYTVTVDAHAEECFFDKVDYGTKMGLIFEIAEGGFLDIDVRIDGPDGKVIYQGDSETRGKYTFAAHTSGIYTYCFSNLKSTLSPKVIMFHIDIGEPPKAVEGDHAVEGQEGQNNHGKLDDMIQELSASLWGVKNEQDFMLVRDRNHRAISESTNFRVIVWSSFEATVLICMTIGQIYYLKRFFEVRRVV